MRWAPIIKDGSLSLLSVLFASVASFVISESSFDLEPQEISVKTKPIIIGKTLFLNILKRIKVF